MAKKLVVLEDTVINTMLKNPAMTREFTFLKTAAAKSAPPKRRSCSRCGARKNRQNVLDYSAIKAAIASLPNDRKALFKRLLNAEQVRLYFTNTSNKKIKMTF